MLPLIFLNYVVALLVNFGIQRIPIFKNNDTWPWVLAGTFLINMWFISSGREAEGKTPLQAIDYGVTAIGLVILFFIGRGVTNWRKKRNQSLEKE